MRAEITGDEKLLIDLEWPNAEAGYQIKKWLFQLSLGYLSCMQKSTAEQATTEISR